MDHCICVGLLYGSAFVWEEEEHNIHISVIYRWGLYGPPLQCLMILVGKSLKQVILCSFEKESDSRVTDLMLKRRASSWSRSFYLQKNFLRFGSVLLCDCPATEIE